ncbi:MAG: YeeE/YedE family protein [Halieaceae bacterium]|jgi:uncharacterized membrane protein YedE/YeeE|nr:YeeE/YedE family protein [Halieaceae bacterium]
MKQWPALITGLLFGAGLALSGMTDPAKVLGFLDIAGEWIPDLAFVMGGALVVTLGATPLILGRARPLLADAFRLPVNKTIDAQLVVGGVIFGIGWGLWGYCPGPAMASLAYGEPTTLMFVAAMLVGMWLDGKLKLVTSRVED